MKTAIEQAKSTFDRLVNLKINKAPLPVGGNRIFAVATLPNGMVAMSDGSQQVSYPQKKREKLRGDAYEEMINQDKIIDQQRDMTLGVALPESQLGKPGEPGVDLIGFLSRFITPQLQSSPEARLTAMIPAVPTDEDFQRTSALSSLPGTTPERRALFQKGDFSKKFLQEGKNVQEELMREFLSQINRGESSSVPGLNRFSAPMIASYENRYALPAAGNPATAQIGTNANQLTNQIR